MKLFFTVFTVLISGFYLSASGSLLTIRAGNDYYQYKNRIDTTSKDSHLYFDFGFGLEDIGGSGLSFETDLKASNAFLDGANGASRRRTYDITTGYFAWESENNVFGARLGRQQYCNLSFDSYDFDGLSIAVQPTSKASVNLAAGLLTPSPWGKQVVGIQQNFDPLTSQTIFLPDTTYKHYLLGNPSNSMVAMLDGTVSAIPFTTLTYGLSLVPAPVVRSTFGYDTLPRFNPDSGKVVADSLVKVVREGDNTGDFRMALGADISPVSYLRFTGSGRFSLYQKGIDRFDARLRFLPGRVGDISVYVLGEKGRIDSTNYFSIMLLKQLTEFGLTANFFSESGIAVQLDYHATSFDDEGTDHFLTFDVSHRYLYGGGVLGFGYHGQIIRAYGGFAAPIGKVISLRGGAEFYRQFPARYQPAPFDPEYEDLLWMQPNITPEEVEAILAGLEPVKDMKSPRNAILFTGGIKMSFSRIGLSLYPRMEYITNRYYKKDVRFLLTTNLLIRKFWTTGGGK